VSAVLPVGVLAAGAACLVTHGARGARSGRNELSGPAKTSRRGKNYFPRHRDASFLTGISDDDAHDCWLFLRSPPATSLVCWPSDSAQCVATSSSKNSRRFENPRIAA
jgi:hypothetical protein